MVNTVSVILWFEERRYDFRGLVGNTFQVAVLLPPNLTIHVRCVSDVSLTVLENELIPTIDILYCVKPNKLVLFENFYLLQYLYSINSLTRT